MLAAAGVSVLIAPHAGTLLLALAVANLFALIPMLGAARRVIARGPRPRAWAVLRGAAPLAAMTLATLVYYRSGTIALSLFSSSSQTARFAAASTIAWGLLSAANAVTTGLLPRLSAARDEADRVAVTRRALVWITAGCTLLAALVALLAKPLLTVLFGARYAGAAGTLALLAGATALIAPAGVLGTALIAVGRLRPVATQVGASLAINLLALAALVPRLGATGAAVATLACEAVALTLLVSAAARAFPGLFTPSSRPPLLSPVLAPKR
jgi:O-antigen/teichoic acid export membrane protein